MDRTAATIRDYDATAAKFDQAYCRRIYFKAQLDRFLSRVPPPATVLDVGCGTGHVARYLCKNGYSVIGIDLSRGMLAIAKARAPAAELLLLDLRKMSGLRREFDAILSIFSLNHVDDVAFSQALADIHAALRRGGWLFLSLPEGEGEVMYCDPLDPTQWMYFHYYSKPAVIAALQRQGFRVVGVEDRFLRKEGHNEFFITACKR
jgi:2-polyprenyl-3-methyl-5-hydroxy-6-metoxy-1,4-benzoquinol methylase